MFVTWSGPSVQATAHHWHTQQHRCMQLRLAWIRDSISTDGTRIDSKEPAAPEREGEPEWQELAHCSSAQ
jgi:hypothetical protein